MAATHDTTQSARLAGQQVLVVGLGITGQSVVSVLARSGANVIALER